MTLDSVFSTKNKNWSSLILATCVVVTCAYLSVRFAAHHTASELFVFVMFCCITLVDFLFVKSLVDKGGLSLPALAKLLGASVAAGLLLEGLTVLGSPGSHFLNIADWSKRRAVVFGMASFIAAQYVYLKVLARNRQRMAFPDFKSAVVKKAPLVAIVVIIGVVVVFRVGVGFPFIFYGLGALALCATFWFFVRKSISLSVAFFLLAFISGSMMMYGLPLTTGLSWDDQIHYENATATSYLYQTQLTHTDWCFSVEATDRALGYQTTRVDIFDLNEVMEHSADLDQSYKDDVAAGRVSIDKSTESIYEINRVGYIPMAIGLWLGRLAHLSFSSMVLFAKMCNLFSYSLVIAIAIAVAPSKKGLFAFVGLLPTSVWQAANFSYDPWLISFVMLGFAYYLRYAWGQSEDFTRKNIALAFGFTFVGLAVKAVYFPVIGLFFIVPKERFSDTAQRRRYNAAVFFLGLLTFASFALPYVLASGTGSSDTRGSSDVDSGKQLAFILSNPLDYLGILARFLFGEYFAPFNSSSFAFDFAYLENMKDLAPIGVTQGAASIAPAASLALVGISSNDETSVRHVNLGASLWALFLTLFTFALVATALYVSFTPVGLGTVNGCQFRYILPMLVPALAIILNNRWVTLGEKTGWKACCLAVSLVFFALCFVVLILARIV